MDSYQKSIFNKFGYFATWLPNAPIALGDVGTLAGGSFQRVTSLGDLGIEFGVRKGAKPIDFSHSSEEGVSMSTSGDVTGKAGPADGKASVTVELGAKGAFIFQAKGCVESAIEDQAKLGREVVERAKSGEEWDPDWVVINTVVEAKCATIMVSDSASSKVSLGADAKLPAGATALADADAGLHVTSQSGDVTHVIGQRGLTPLFRVSRIKRGLLAAIRKALFGEVKFDAVRSIGPQVFADDGEASGEAELEGLDALEEVRPE